MADYKDRIDEWQQAALRKARELDEKFAISDLVGEGARVASEAARRGAETMATGAERLRVEAEQLTDDEEVGDAGKKAGLVLEGAKTYSDRASQFYDTGARFTRASTGATSGLIKARDWIKENPGKAAVVSGSLVLGIRAGAAFSGLERVLLG